MNDDDMTTVESPLVIELLEVGGGEELLQTEELLGCNTQHKICPAMLILHQASANTSVTTN
jgi:hypothetical protein